MGVVAIGQVGQGGQGGQGGRGIQSFEVKPEMAHERADIFVSYRGDRSGFARRAAKGAY